MLPGGRGSFRAQAEDLFAQLTCLLKRQSTPLTATTMMVFLRDGTDEKECRKIVSAYFGDSGPVTTFVVQPPCGGAALGLELWAVGGPGVRVQPFSPHLLTVESEGIRWIYCAGICGQPGSDGAYGESVSAFRQMQAQLALAGASFAQVVRTWLYINQITSEQTGRLRYQELNRARTDFYHKMRFNCGNRAPCAPQTIYPASTGIGSRGSNIVMSCMALDTQRPDVFVLPLENPQQTSAYEYGATYSPQSPKFSRAMAVVQGHFVCTLVSGTASIVDARTCHPGDIVRQTEQTIDNIEKLIAPENFARHGVTGAGAGLTDIAKLRVYIRRAQDYQQCREVCERRLPRVPAIYLEADICRPDLLVEIEAVAFSPLGKNFAMRKVNR
jgi:enamine deaminase RidA (YjgF/YER057c/UK114 family)